MFKTCYIHVKFYNTAILPCSKPKICVLFISKQDMMNVKCEFDVAEKLLRIRAPSFKHIQKIVMRAIISVRKNTGVSFISYIPFHVSGLVKLVHKEFSTQFNKFPKK